MLNTLILTTSKKSAYKHTRKIKISEEQNKQIINSGLIPFLHPRLTPKGEVNFTPSVRLPGNKTIHIGQFLFPENERLWDEDI